MRVSAPTLPIVEGTIYQRSQPIGGKPAQMYSSRTSGDLHADENIMWKAVEFRYAAIRQKKLLIVDMVPRWKAFLMKHLLGVEVGCMRTRGDPVRRRRTDAPVTKVE